MLMCRICLSLNTELVRILPDMEATLLKLTGKKDLKMDDFSSYICLHCAFDLRQTGRLISMCQESDQTWKDFYSTSTLRDPELARLFFDMRREVARKIKPTMNLKKTPNICLSSDDKCVTNENMLSTHVIAYVKGKMFTYTIIKKISAKTADDSRQTDTAKSRQRDTADSIQTETTDSADSRQLDSDDSRLIDTVNSRLNTSDSRLETVDASQLDSADSRIITLDTSQLDTADSRIITLDTSQLDTADSRIITLDTSQLDTADSRIITLDTSQLDTADSRITSLDSRQIDSSDSEQSPTPPRSIESKQAAVARSREMAAAILEHIAASKLKEMKNKSKKKTAKTIPISELFPTTKPKETSSVTEQSGTTKSKQKSSVTEQSGTTKSKQKSSITEQSRTTKSKQKSSATEQSSTTKSKQKSSIAEQTGITKSKETSSVTEQLATRTSSRIQNLKEKKTQIISKKFVDSSDDEDDAYDDFGDTAMRSLSNSPEPQTEFVVVSEKPEFQTEFAPERQTELMELSIETEIHAEDISPKSPELQPSEFSDKSPEPQCKIVDVSTILDPLQGDVESSQMHEPHPKVVNVSQRPEPQKNLIIVSQPPKPPCKYITVSQSSQSKEGIEDMSQRPKPQLKVVNVSHPFRHGYKLIGTPQSSKQQQDIVDVTQNPESQYEVVDMSTFDVVEAEYLDMTNENEQECISRDYNIKINANEGREITLSKEEQMMELDVRRKKIKFMFSTYKCDKCVKTFSHKDALNDHIEIHNETRGNIVCDICEIRFESDKELQAHSDVHSHRIECRKCVKRFKGRKEFQRHMENHKDVVYQCALCYATFRDEKMKLVRHMKRRHLDIEYNCDFCPTSFKFKSMLDKHRYHHIPKHQCRFCDTKSHTKHHMHRHLRLRHQQEMQTHNYCMECDAEFGSAQQLKDHIKTTDKHINPHVLIYPCRQCSKCFDCEELLLYHMSCHHTRRAAIRCQDCGVGFPSPAMLNTHVNRWHKSNKLQSVPCNYVCHICGKEFGNNSVLCIHLKNHVGELPYECKRCDRKFSQESSLIKHIKLVHISIKPRYVRNATGSNALNKTVKANDSKKPRKEIIKRRDSSGNINRSVVKPSNRNFVNPVKTNNNMKSNTNIMKPLGTGMKEPVVVLTRMKLI